MKSISVEEFELLDFFETQPEVDYTDIPWFYAESVYEIKNGKRSLIFTISPSYKNIHVVVNQEDEKLFELEASNVKDVKLIKEKITLLEIKINEFQLILIKCKPYISIYQKIVKEN